MMRSTMIGWRSKPVQTALAGGLVLLLTACSSGSDDAAEPVNTAQNATVQVAMDGAVTSFDSIKTPVTDGTTVLSEAEIIATQTEFDKIGDSLLQQ